MIAKSNFIKIIWRVALIMINCLVLAFLFYNSSHYVIITHLFLLVILQSWLLSRFLNQSHKNIHHLLESYANNDAMQLSSTKSDAVYTQKIYTQLSEINSKTRESEKKLTKQLSYMHAVTKNISGGLITILNDGKVDLYSNSVLELTTNRAIHSLNDFKQNEDLYDTLKIILPGERKVLKLNTQDGLQILSFSCSELKSDDGKTRIITYENIKKELDEQEIQSWQKLIRVLSHEMMNSFSSIISTNETLGMLLEGIQFKNDKRIGPDDLLKIEKMRKGIEIMNERSKGITHFIDKYRQLAKLPKPVCEDVFVRKIFEETILLHEESLKKKNIKWMIEIHPDDLSLFVDPQLIIQVLINLVKNSMEALDGFENPRLHLKAKRNHEDRIVVTVSDNGCGIDKADLSEIFIPFFTNKKEGSGIGLSLSRQIMHLHKGEIRANQNDSETEFVLTF